MGLSPVCGLVSDGHGLMHPIHAELTSVLHYRAARLRPDPDLDGYDHTDS